MCAVWFRGVNRSGRGRLLALLATKHSTQPHSFQLRPLPSLPPHQIIAAHLPYDQIRGLKELFEAIDADGSGTITTKAMRAAVAQRGSKVSEEEMERLMAAAVSGLCCISQQGEGAALERGRWGKRKVLATS